MQYRMKPRALMSLPMWRRKGLLLATIPVPHYIITSLYHNIAIIVPNNTVVFFKLLSDFVMLYLLQCHIAEIKPQNYLGKTIYMTP